MSEDQDNAGEVVASAVRVALTAAGQLAEQAARRREADLREAERDSAARVATLQSQLAAERELALRSVRDVVQRGNAATIDEVVRAWEQARSWDDPTMGIEQAQLEDRVRERFGVGASSLPGDRSSAEHAAAVIVTRDVGLQAADARQRQTALDRVTQLQAELVTGGVDDEAASARALAAESHPTDVSEAARRPQFTPVGRPQGRRRSRVIEVQSPRR